LAPKQRRKHLIFNMGGIMSNTDIINELIQLFKQLNLDAQEEIAGILKKIIRENKDNVKK